MAQIFNAQMLPANATGRDDISIEYIVTAPVASVRIPNKGLVQTAQGAPLPFEDSKEISFRDFPLLGGFL